MLAIGTSVWINADSPAEPGHADSRAILDRAAAMGTAAIVPLLLQVEVAGVISRIRRDPVLAVDFANEIAALPFVRWIALDEAIAVRAVTLAAGQSFRGADTVYAAVAEQYRRALVSLDKEHLNRFGGYAHARGSAGDSVAAAVTTGGVGCSAAAPGGASAVPFRGRQYSHAPTPRPTMARNSRIRSEYCSIAS